MIKTKYVVHTRNEENFSSFLFLYPEMKFEVPIMKQSNHLLFQSGKLRRHLIRILPPAVLFCLVTAAYISGYNHSVRQPVSPEVQTEIPEQIHSDQKNLIGEILPANDAQEIYITPRMTYTLQTYDSAVSGMTEQVEIIPTAMYGLSRTELAEYLTKLAAQENESLTDREVGYDLISFSRDNFTVRKTISERAPEYAIFLIAEEGYLTAYRGDLTKHLRIYTDSFGGFSIKTASHADSGNLFKNIG